MVELTNKSQAKTAMLLELESIKGLLLESDEIPILQEVEESSTGDLVELAEKDDDQKPRGRHFVEHQKDFFHDDAPTLSSTQAEPQPRSATDHHTRSIGSSTAPRSDARGVLKKPTGENPFLPEHIRARLHGNNPPPSYEQMTANRIAQSHKPSRLLGNVPTQFAQNAKENLINEIVDKFLPEIEIELREKLEKLTDQQLDELRKS